MPPAGPSTTQAGLGICCFSDTYDNELTWSHASKYSGICVGYRTKELIEGLPTTCISFACIYGAPPSMGKRDADFHETAIIILYTLYLARITIV